MQESGYVRADIGTHTLLPILFLHPSTSILPPPSPTGVDVDWRQAGDGHHHRPQLQTHLTITNYFHFQAGEAID